MAIVAMFLCGTAQGRSVAQPDLVIRGGQILDGSGGAPFIGDVVVDGDRIVAVVRGRADTQGRREVDARGLSVVPGFINMLSHSMESLLADGRGLSDIRQGVTLEVFGEGRSMGPWNSAMKRDEIARQGDLKSKIIWTSLGEYLAVLEKKGVSPNIASFVGATTIRIHELGESDVDPTLDQLARMRALVRQAMEEGALGVGSSLIYAPASYAETPELIALASEAGRCGGMYISHLRSEGDQLIEAVEELIEISRKSGARAEIYHIKQAGTANWGKVGAVLAMIESARAAGLAITADMYSYTAGATGLDAAMPPWVQAGGLEQWIARLRDPEIRARVEAAMRSRGDGWENLYQQAGGAENLILIGFRNPALKPFTGRTLAEVAKMRGTSPERTAIDLVIEDGSRVETAYQLMSEENVRRLAAVPWISLGSDAEALADETPFLKRDNHPRAYGNFARFLGHYVREQGATTLPDAIRRLTRLPATNLGLRDRGELRPGYHADIVILDPATIGDLATFDRPRRYATGVRDVFVNGVQILRNGAHTGLHGGRVVRGPGWTGWPDGGACGKF